MAEQAPKIQTGLTQPAPEPQQQQPAQTQPPQPTQEPQSGGFFKDDLGGAVPSDVSSVGLPEPESEITWQASEFIRHDKSASWYLGLFTVAALAGAGIYAITRDIVSVVVVGFAAFFLAYFGAHKPRQLEYRIDGKGITVGGKFYAYSDFRSFSLVPEGAFNSIVFMPLKRFAVPLSIYYDPRAETQIIDVLKNCLPFEPSKLDVSEKLMRKIRF